MTGFVRKSVVAGLAATLLLGPMAVSAQQAGAPPRRQGEGERAAGPRDAGGERGGRFGGDRQFDPARFREMMLERYREPLGVSDEEWKAIKPLIENVVDKQTATRAMGMMRFGRGGFGGDRGPGRGGEGRPGAEARPAPREGDRPSPFGQPSPEVDALEKALESKDTPVKDIETKLKALRAARQKAEEELKAAREKLRAVLTIRQEAQLVLMGLLD